MKLRVLVLLLASVLLMAFSFSPAWAEPPVSIGPNGMRFDGDMFSSNITFYAPSTFKAGTFSAFGVGSLNSVDISANPDMPEGLNGAIDISAHSEDAGDSSTVKLDTNENGQIMSQIFMNKENIGLNSTLGPVKTSIFGTNEEFAVLEVDGATNSVTITGSLNVNGPATFTGMIIAPKEGNLVISGDSINLIDSPYSKIDTEGAAATDNLCYINGGVTGQVLELSTVSSARDVTILDGGPCNIDISGNFTLDHINDIIVMKLQSSGTWIGLGEHNNH